MTKLKKSELEATVERIVVAMYAHPSVTRDKTGLRRIKLSALREAILTGLMNKPSKCLTPTTPPDQQ